MTMSHNYVFTNTNSSIGDGITLHFIYVNNRFHGSIGYREIKVPKHDPKLYALHPGDFRPSFHIMLGRRSKKWT